MAVLSLARMIQGYAQGGAKHAQLWKVCASGRSTVAN